MEMHTDSAYPPDVIRLTGEVRDLNAQLRELLERLPQARTHTKTWLQPVEFAELAGLGHSTVRAWRRRGVFRPESLRVGPRGYQFHRDHALLDALEAQR